MAKETILIIKTKKATATEERHHDVYFNDVFLGYFMPNHNKFAAVNENWNFVSKNDDVQYFHAQTKNELIETLEAQVTNKPVMLKQHFGIKTLVNPK